MSAPTGSEPRTEREYAREIAQLRVAQQSDALPEPVRQAAARAAARLEERVEWTSAPNALAAMSGRKPERYEDEGYPMPDLDDLGLVRGDGA